MSDAKKTILVIEDESMICRLIDRLLTKTGYDVITAVNGEEGVTKFKENIEIIDLVILDMSLPKLPGAQVLKHLRIEKPGIRVLLSSGWQPSEVNAHFSEDKPAGFLPKPFQSSGLLDKVSEMLG